MTRSRITAADVIGDSLAHPVPRVMGVLNLTPDSFSDGGLWTDPARALAHAEEMVAAGAAIIDVGGESTRPGAAPVTVDDECARILPVIERLVATLDVPVSVDTSKPQVMRAAIDAGAAMVNDVMALQAPGAFDAVADTGVVVCLMHMRGEPRTMQANPRYDDVTTEVRDFLAARVRACSAAGIPPERIVIDPGFGFGKTVAHNLELLARLDEIVALGQPVMVGLSRKSVIGTVTGAPVDGRLPGSLAAAVLAVGRGARILRVHDVAETVQAVAFASAVNAGRRDG